jgi:hypothetical protein
MRYELLFALALSKVALGGCGQSERGEADAGGDAALDASSPDGSEVFESDDPRVNDLYGSEDDDSDHHFCEGEGEGWPVQTRRARAEAKRSVVDGLHIVALSPHGLTVIEAAADDGARLVGRDLSIDAPIAIELLSGGVVVVVSDAPDDSQCASQLRTRLTALDVREPGDVRTLFQEDLDGVYTGLQLTGSVLYLTTISFSSAAVTSFDVSDPRAPARIATRNFFPDSAVAQEPVLRATGSRLYTAVQRSASDVEISVIPLDGDRGSLAIATTFETAGWLESGWQLDEHDGTLRVVTAAQRLQPASALETFAISEDHQVSPLARVELQPGVFEVLFDGARGYAYSSDVNEIAGSEWQPIDLRDPAAPRLAAPIDLPGRDVVLVPLGERLFAIAQDTTPASDGAGEGFTVSLFDVANPLRPIELDAQRIDGQHTYLSSAEAGLIAVPIWREQPLIQLIDVGGDAIALRAAIELAAPAEPVQRFDQRMLVTSRDTAELFAVDNPAAPRHLGAIALARQVTHTARAGDQVVLVGPSDQFRVFLDVHALDAAPSSLPLGSIDWAPPGAYDRSVYVEQLHVEGVRVYVQYRAFGDTITSRVAVVDLSDLARPEVLSDQLLGGELAEDGSQPYAPFVTRPIEHGFVQLDALDSAATDGNELPGTMLRLLQVTDTEPQGIGELALADSAEPATLQTLGGRVYAGRLQAHEGDARVRFFVDAIDIADPTEPHIAGTYNVPGRLLNVLDDDRLLTVGYRRIRAEDDSYSSCWERGGRVLGDRLAEPVACIVMEETLHLVRLERGAFVLEDSYTLPPAAHVIQSAIGTGRVFVVTSSSDERDEHDEILVLAHLHSGRLDPELVELHSARLGVALGASFVFLGHAGDAFVVDATEADQASTFTLPGICWWRERVCAPSDSGFVAMGYAGIAALDLEQP